MFPQMQLISHLPSLSLSFCFGSNHCTNQLCEITEQADRDQNTLVCHTCDPGADLGEEKTETTGIAPGGCIHVGPPPNERKLFFLNFFFFFFSFLRVIRTKCSWRNESKGFPVLRWGSPPATPSRPHIARVPRRLPGPGGRPLRTLIHCHRAVLCFTACPCPRQGEAIC